MTAVLEHSQRGGSHFVVLFVIASYSDENGEWKIDQATLQKRARLGQRRIQQILAELAADRELEVVRGDGRGRTSTYRILAGQPGQPRKGEAECTLSGQKGEAPCTLSTEKGEEECTLSGKKGEAGCTLSTEKGEGGCTLSAEKGEAECTLSAGSSPPIPPSSPVRNKEEAEESFALGLRPLKPLTDQQSAVHRVRLLLEEAGVPILPSPAQVVVWVKAAGGTELLLERLNRLITAGLATKSEPLRYIHRVVQEEARRRGSESALRPRVAGGRAGLDPRREQQALRLIKRSED